jgi:hypothetical protein
MYSTGNGATSMRFLASLCPIAEGSIAIERCTALV